MDWIVCFSRPPELCFDVVVSCTPLEAIIQRNPLQPRAPALTEHTHLYRQALAVTAKQAAIQDKRRKELLADGSCAYRRCADRLCHANESALHACGSVMNRCQEVGTAS